MHDPNTGEVTDIVIFTGTELDLYSPATFTKTSTLQSGFAAASTAMSLGEGIGYAGGGVDGGGGGAEGGGAVEAAVTVTAAVE